MDPLESHGVARTNCVPSFPVTARLPATQTRYYILLIYMYPTYGYHGGNGSDLPASSR